MSEELGIPLRQLNPRGTRRRNNERKNTEIGLPVKRGSRNPRKNTETRIPVNRGPLSPLNLRNPRRNTTIGIPVNRGPLSPLNLRNPRNPRRNTTIGIPVNRGPLSPLNMTRRTEVQHLANPRKLTNNPVKNLVKKVNNPEVKKVIVQHLANPRKLTNNQVKNLVKKVNDPIVKKVIVQHLANPNKKKEELEMTNKQVANVVKKEINKIKNKNEPVELNEKLTKQIVVALERDNCERVPKKRIIETVKEVNENVNNKYCKNVMTQLGGLKTFKTDKNTQKYKVVMKLLTGNTLTKNNQLIANKLKKHKKSKKVKSLKEKKRLYLKRK